MPISGIDQSSWGFLIGFNMGIVFWVGINDVSPISCGGVHIASYAGWKNMLKRCYDKKWQQRNRTYIGCRVSDDWLVFSNFKAWFDNFYVPGWQIDKDLLNPGNKVYDASNCVFIPKSLNTFLTAHDALRGKHPLGVHFHKQKKRFIAQISVGGVSEQIGAYETAQEAHVAWFHRKIELAYEYKGLCDSIDPRLFEGVLRKINSMKEV